MADILVEEAVVQSTSQACLIDVTAPTFGGIVSLTSNDDGSLTVAWAAATDPSAPISYEVYVKKTSATGLFLPTNLALVTRSLSARIFALADATVLENSATYYVGIRARDGVGNVDNNIMSLSAISEGVQEGDIVYGVHGAWSIDSDNNLRCSFWVTENGQLTTSVLGTADFQVYTRAGAALSGVAGSGIAADGNGLYHAPAVSAALIQDLNHYLIRIAVTVDGIERVMVKGLNTGN